MNLTPQNLSREMTSSGFGGEPLEKVFRLIALLVAECRERLAIVLPLQPHELEFLERLNGAGDIVPEVLTDVPAMQAILRDHPGLRWKARNVKKRLGVAIDDPEPSA